MPTIIPIRLFRLVFASCLFAASALAQPGRPPFEAYAQELAAYRPANPDDLTTLLPFVRNTQVYQRAVTLELNAVTPFVLLDAAGTLYDQLAAAKPDPTTTLALDVATTSELFAQIAGKSNLLITLAPRRITVDAPIDLPVDDMTFDFAGATFDTTRFSGDYVLRIEDRRRIRVRNLVLQSVSNNGILISASHDIEVSACRFDDVVGNPIVIVADTSRFDVAGNQFSRAGRSALHVQYGPHDGLIRDNVIRDGQGHSNFHAGILLSDRGTRELRAPEEITPDGYWNFPQRITERLNTPTRILVVGNTIENHLTSGIYSDGACGNCFVNNRIIGNSKEGLCLDNGSTANVVIDNLIQGNGQRFGKSDEQLELDYVLRFGRLPDGTAAAKVAGVSIDNAMHNLVAKNTVEGNYGGGVKMVRTSFDNHIVANRIHDNNRGVSDVFHYFGVELGAATADIPLEELDFTPSCGNRIAANHITGPHYAGVFLAPGAMINSITGNTISDITHHAIETAIGSYNMISDNTTPDEAPPDFNPPACGAGLPSTSLLAFALLFSFNRHRRWSPAGTDSGVAGAAVYETHRKGGFPRSTPHVLPVP